MMRGKPFKGDVIHLRIPQQRPEMAEGVDYPTQVACHNGNYHIYYTNDTSEVTCEKCKEVGRIKAWNKHVDGELIMHQTFLMETPDGVLCIEHEPHRVKAERYVAWWKDDSSCMSYGETPHEAYSDLGRRDV